VLAGTMPHLLWGLGFLVVLCAGSGCQKTREFSAGSTGGAADGGSGATDAGGATDADGGMGGRGEAGSADDGCTPGDSRSCYESAEGMSYGGNPPVGQVTCRFGLSACSPERMWEPCAGAIAPLDADTCEPGDDANCDGVPNEGCACTNGEERACGSNEGICQQGRQTCSGKVWGECAGEIRPALRDSCEEGDDANCNGKPNEGCNCINGETKACGTDIGPCEFGTLTCKDGNWPDDSQCQGGTEPAAKDSCAAGNDENCNGTPNEGCACKGNESQECGRSVGACRYGMQTCSDGVLSTCIGGVNPTGNDTCLARDAANDTNCNGNSGDGCECVASDGPKAGCGDSGCGHQLCDGARGTYKACSNANSNSRCNPNNPNQRQLCGPNGVFIAQECESNQWCTGSGTCKLKDGAACTAGADADCATGKCSQFYTDTDGDGYRASNSLANFCGTSKVGYVAKSLAKAQLDCSGGDSNEFVFPGAEEICDGLDNDCDGIMDREDVATLPLGGGSQAKLLTAGKYPSGMAWSGTNYGIVYADASSQARFAAVKQDNQQSFIDVDVGTKAPVTINWNGANFGIFAGATASATPGVRYYKGTTAGVVTTGNPTGFGTSPVGGLGSLSAAPMGASGWYVAGTGRDVNFKPTGYGYTLSATKQGTETAGLAPNSDNLKVAVSGTTYGLLYKVPNGINWDLYFSPRDAEGQKQPSGNGGLPNPVLLGSLGSGDSSIAITGLPGGGFAVASISDSANDKMLFVRQIAVDGTSACGTARTLGVAGNLAWVNNLVPTKRGFLVSTHFAATLQLYEIIPGCKFAANPYLAIDTTGIDYNAMVGSGADGYLLLWAAANNLYTRNLGPDICN
jgi:Putative metal-binding motif